MRDTLKYNPYDPTVSGKERSYLKPYAVKVELHPDHVVVHHSPDESEKMSHYSWGLMKPKNYRVVADCR